MSDTQADGIFVFSGYLSQKGNEEKMLSDFLNSNIKYFGFGNTTKSNIALIKEHENVLSKRNILLSVTRKDKMVDHRKMVFIFRANQNGKITPRDLCRVAGSDPWSKLDDFMNSIDVLCVAVGSSNFSYKTYFGSDYDELSKTHTGCYVADKGEADIMMFHDEAFKDRMIQMIDNDEDNGYHRNRMVLSQSLTNVPTDFLKIIFRESLEGVLG